MGIFSGLFGNASQTPAEKAEKELAQILVPGEEIFNSFILIRDLIVFTEKRLIIVDKQGLTGKKIAYQSFPYQSISRFSIETTGHFDLDAELKIWVSSATEPAVALQFNGDEIVIDIQQTLAAAILDL